jgi:hypothetical protein
MIQEDCTCHVFAGTEHVSGSNDGALLEAHFNCPIALAMDEENYNIFVADSKNKSIRMISFKCGTVTTICQADCLGDVNDIAYHKNTGDLFIVEARTNYFLRISKNGSGLGQWTFSIIFHKDYWQSWFCSMTIFQDTLFITTWTGLVIQSSLDGKTASTLAELSPTQLMGIAVNDNAVFVTEDDSHVITKISYIMPWTPHNHCNLLPPKKQLIDFIVVASLCHTNTSPSNLLRKLPREILLHMLCFLDHQSI